MLFKVDGKKWIHNLTMSLRGAELRWEELFNTNYKQKYY